MEVIKFGMNHRSVGWHTQGDVEQLQDPHIHKNVFKIRGAIAATNYLRVPRFATLSHLLLFNELLLFAD